MVKWPHRECFCSEWQQTWTTQRTNQKLRQWSSEHLSRVKWLRPRNSALHLFSGFAETNFLFNGALVMWLNIRKRKLSIFTRVPWLTFPVRMSWFKVLTQEKIPLSNVWFPLQIYRPNNRPSRREISIKLNFVNCMYIKQEKKKDQLSFAWDFLAFPCVQIKRAPFTDIRPLLEDANKCTLNYLFLHLYI